MRHGVASQEEIEKAAQATRDSALALMAKKSQPTSDDGGVSPGGLKPAASGSIEVTLLKALELPEDEDRTHYYCKTCIETVEASKTPGDDGQLEMVMGRGPMAETKHRAMHMGDYSPIFDTTQVRVRDCMSEYVLVCRGNGRGLVRRWGERGAGAQTLVAGSAEAFLRVELWCTDAPHEQPAEARHIGAAEAAMLSAAREAHEPVEHCVAGLRLMLSSLAEDERQCYQVVDRSLDAHILRVAVACTLAVLVCSNSLFCTALGTRAHRWLGAAAGGGKHWRGHHLPPARCAGDASQADLVQEGPARVNPQKSF